MRFITHILPLLIILESVLAGIVCFCYGKAGSGMYWFSTALIIVAATIMIPKWG